MIRYVRATRLKKPEAWKWAWDVTAYINEKFPEAELKFFSRIYGKVNQVFWEVDFENLQTLDAYLNKINQDEGFQELLANSQGYLAEISETLKSSMGV